jgi:hypothetical protein
VARSHETRRGIATFAYFVNGHEAAFPPEVPMFAQEVLMTGKARSLTRPFVCLFAAGLLLGLLSTPSVRGETPTPTPTPTPTATPTPTPIASPATPSIDKVRVIEVYNLGQANNPKPEYRNSAGLQDVIVVKVHDLQSLTRAAKCLSKDDRHVDGCHEQAIALFLDGRQIKGIVPESGAPTIEELPGKDGLFDGTLQFHLQRNADSDEAWADLLGAPPFGKGFFERPTEVSVGLENGYALPTEVVHKPTVATQGFALIRIHIEWFIPCSILLVIVFFSLFLLAWYSELLRDIGPKPPPPPDLQTGGNKLRNWWKDRKKRKHKPYSLARFQMAVWFLLVVASFLFIWLISFASDTITGSTLALIGIGSGTALGAAAIDITSQDNGAGASTPPESRGFLTDILTDGANGVSFHRFQMFVWTFVLALLFIYSVWNRLSMPEFNTTLLALMGISSGTYLGFKIPENQT